MHAFSWFLPVMFGCAPPDPVVEPIPNTDSGSDSGSDSDVVEPTPDLDALWGPEDTTTAPFTRGMVSFTFDDGWLGQATIASPKLVERGWKGTFYLVPEWFGTSMDGEAFMTLSGASDLVAAGHEIGDHTMSHATLTNLVEPEVFDEMADCQLSLESTLGLPPGAVANFSTPHGAYNDAVLADARLLFTSHRTGEARLNTPATDPYTLGGVLLEASNLDYPGRTPDDVEDVIQLTAERRSWLILVFHGFVEGELMRVTDQPLDAFDRILDEVAEADVDVVTIAEGVQRMPHPP